MSVAMIAIGVVMLASTPHEGEVFDGVSYPAHASSAGRADTRPIESNDVTYPEVHAAFDKEGPPGPGVDIITDRNIYGSGEGTANSTDQ